MNALFNRLKSFNINVRGIIQVGASIGQELKVFTESGVKKALLIEPLDDCFPRLVATAKESGPGFYPIQALCADKEGEQYNFNVASNGGQSSSLLEPLEHLKLHPAVVFSQQQITMVSRTLDSLVAEFMALHPDEKVEDFNLLYLDTQGAEKKVLMGADAVLSNCSAIWTEISNVDLYKGGVRLPELISYLDDKGFYLVFASINPKFWGDALFIRKPAS